MAKLSLINRQVKREQLVKKYAPKRKALQAIINDSKRSDEERVEARQKLQARRVCVIVVNSPGVRVAPSGNSVWRVTSFAK